MPLLFEDLRESVSEWRRNGYPCDAYPLIGEILSWQKENHEDNLSLKYLRDPQFLALEVYWYVRLVLQTPHIIDLYKHYYGDDKKKFFRTLGISITTDALGFAEIEAMTNRIKKDEDFVKEKGLHALHEAVNLDYPSYILALAMGAGKTVLIGTIIATEFSMSMRHPDSGGDIRFMKNALVFAPGTTIIESLRELSEIPYQEILPPDLNRDFLANLKIEFPGKEKDIQAQTGSSYNLIVTNTEKIALRARKRSNHYEKDFEKKELQANLRLGKIASLPDLGIFSDEAHHTYGNTFDRLKRVRETINYINEKRPVVAVINTTGTPYYKRQPLKEVIVWYGLGDGINDNILKDLKKGIHQYDIGEQSEQAVFKDIVGEFFKTYGGVSLPDGAKAKIAFYFKSQEHLESSKSLIEQAMTEIGQDVSQVLINTQQSSSSEVDEFRRLNNPDNQKRVILLIGKGVEGWNCPSLFACALIKEQTTSNNYVLQASTRCLRQVRGNSHSAKVFLDQNNAQILDKELQDNFGTDLERLGKKNREKETITLRIRKVDQLPKLERIGFVEKVVRKNSLIESIRLEKPMPQEAPGVLRSILTPDFSSPREILMPTGETQELPPTSNATDCHTTAWKLASRYHLPVMTVLQQLDALYPEGEIPSSHVYGLHRQIEEQQANYERIEEQVKDVMALIRVHDENGEEIFEKENGVYVHHLRLLKDTHGEVKDNDLIVEDGSLGQFNVHKDENDISYHYMPYKFDSKPERSLFQKILHLLNTDLEEVEAFLFTGGLTDPKKTDFHFEYLGQDKRHHPYFPDFVLVKKTGEYYIIEVKSEREKGNEVVEAKKKAVEKLTGINPEKFKYEVIYTPDDTMDHRKIESIVNWIRS